jgi:hypothetical protein
MRAALGVVQFTRCPLSVPAGCKSSQKQAKQQLVNVSKSCLATRDLGASSITVA